MTSDSSLQDFFRPRAAARRTEIERLRDTPAALIIYEAPHRIQECIGDLADILEPERHLLVARELTKLFEEIACMPLADAPSWVAASENRRRGEFVLVVSRPPPRQGIDAETERVLKLLLEELPTRSAAKLASEITGGGEECTLRTGIAVEIPYNPLRCNRSPSPV
jgi:16S rRNA (cytidine1402-2'-O)-methyltransferase